MFRREHMGKGLTSIVMGGFLSLLGGYYAGRASAEEVNVEKQTISSPSSSSASSCQEEFSKALQTKVREYDRFCSQLGMDEEATRACSSLLGRLKTKLWQSNPDIKGLEENPLADEKQNYLCRNIRKGKYQEECHSFFSKVQSAFIHDCEFQGIRDNSLTEEMEYGSFCSYFSTEPLGNECESDFHEGIERYCNSPPPAEKKQYLDKVKDAFLDGKKPLLSEKEMEEIAIGKCRDDLSLEPVQQLLSLQVSPKHSLYGTKLSAIVIQSAQKSEKKEKERGTVCKGIVDKTRIEDLCKQTSESSEECRRLIRNGWLKREDLSKTLGQHCSDLGTMFYQRTIRNLQRGYGKRETRFGTDEAQAVNVQEEVEKDCQDNFNVESRIDICKLLLPSDPTPDDIWGKGNIPYLITSLDALPQAVNNNSSAPSWSVPVFVRSTGWPSLHIIASDFSRLSITPSSSPDERGVYYFDLNLIADNWVSNKVNIYELALQISNQGNRSAPARLTVQYDATKKINPAERVHSNTALVWSLTESGYAHGVRTEMIYTPLPGQNLISNVKLALHGEGGLRQVLKEYRVKGERSPELYGKVSLGLGIKLGSGFRKYPFMMEVGGGYSESYNLHPTTIVYGAASGNEMFGRDAEYRLQIQGQMQKISEDSTISWNSLEVRMATLLSKERHGWGLSAGGKIEDLADPRRYELSAGIKYRTQQQSPKLRNVELELRGLVEHLSAVPEWRLKYPLEATGNGLALGAAFLVNFEFP